MRPVDALSPALPGHTDSDPMAEPLPGADRPSIYLRSVREAGLSALRVIALVSIAAYVGYLIFDCHTSDCSNRVVPRLLLIALNLALLGAVQLAPRFTVDHYEVVIGGLIALLLMTTILLTSRLLGNGGTASSPILLLALFVVYVFVRLPAWSLLLLGTSACLFGFFYHGIRLPFGEHVEIRTLVNLALINAMGYALAHSIDQRERKLYIEQLRSAHHETELKARTAVAEQAIAEKNRLIAAIGHDLRQPLMAAHLHGEILRHRLSINDTAGAEYQAAELVAGLDQLKSSVEQLLMVSRDARTGVNIVGDVAIAPLLRRVGWVFDDECRALGLELRIAVPATPLIARTDAEALFRVLVNLVGNAVKFSRAAPPITDGRREVRGIVLKAGRRDDRILIRVADNGIGMAADDLERVWEAFYQSGPAISRHREGLGLGLYLVRRSLQKLPSHEVRLRSSPGHGTRFTLSLPAAVEGDEPAEAAEPTAPGASPLSPGV